jgi:release factor glutamine methyltransferase
MDSIESYKKKIAQELALKINLPLREASLESQFIMQYILKKSSSNLIINKDKYISKTEREKIENVIKDRINNLPLAYIFKEWDFYGHTFKITKDTLIPRQDTELLIDIILHKYNINLPLKILDLGTGSGVIGVTLARNFTKSNVLISDISIKAIEIAKKNIQNNNLKNIKCIRSNWFDKINFYLFDIIVSNPPYIANDDLHLKCPEIIEQPEVALVSDNEGLKDIETIISQAQKYLQIEGMLLIEHGYNQANKVKEIFLNYKFYNIKQHKDINNKIRSTSGIKI